MGKIKFPRFFTVVLIIMITGVLLFPLCIGNNIGDYYTLHDSFFGLGGYMAFNFGFLALALFASLAGGFMLAFLEQGIYILCTSKKRKLNAITQIPILQQNIENLTMNAVKLKA